MVTKQQQLEWLASSWSIWDHSASELFMSKIVIGCLVSTIDDSHRITLEEWRKSRYKMRGKPEVDNSWYERGELPHVGVPVELWFGGSFAYNCEFIVMRGNAYVVWNLDDDKPDCADRMNSQFRPLRTELEKAIDEMVSIIKGAAFQDPEFTAAILYDAGYRKVKS